MNGNNKQLLVNLQQGACTITESPAEAVIVKQASRKTEECCSKPTDSVTIDSNSFGSDQCADIEFTLENNTEETQIVRFGKPGQAGVYQKLNLEADASNVAGVTADAGDGPEPNVLPLQGFNFLTQDGIVVTGIEIEVLAGGDAQGSQRLSLVRQSVNVTDKCRTTRVRPSCPECPQDNAPQVFFYKFCRMWDAYNHADYSLLPGASVTARIHYAGLATAKGVVACAGTNAGQIVTQIVTT